ncbi:MAG: hypothetical protein NC124_20520, partial [Clostridium sp.]|nr:hypothetical protein [Clostridium sp.]
MGTKKEAKKEAKEIKDTVMNRGDSYLQKNSRIGDEQENEMEQKKAQCLQSMAETENEKKIVEIMNSYAMEIYQMYLPEISKKYKPIAEDKNNSQEENRIRYFDITKWVTDAKEKNIDKLVNVYQTLMGQKSNIALIYNRTTTETKVKIAISNEGKSSDPVSSDALAKRLEKSLIGNFPGAQVSEVKKGTPCTISEKEDENDFYYSVAAISNVASDKSEDFISQSIEKLLDGIIPSKESEEYTLVLLAEPFQEQDSIRARLSEIYSELSPFMQWQSNIAITEGEMLGAGATVGVNAGASVGVTFFASLGFNVRVNMAKTLNRMEQLSENRGITRTYINY